MGENEEAMKSKRVLRYYCDFCKKSGQSSYHLKRHEQGCTLNPDRKCGICLHAGFHQKPMAELTAAFGDYDMKRLREACEDCPACILATLRQVIGKQTYEWETGDCNWPKFDFQKELQAFWVERHDPVPVANRNRTA